MRNSISIKGFTLVELLVALVVTSVILGAVSTLAFALSYASKSAGDISLKQTQLRLTTLRVQELIRNSRLICSQSDEDIAVWFSDSNNDNNININELIFIEFGEEGDHLSFHKFPSTDKSALGLDSINSYPSKWWTSYSSEPESVVLLKECENLEIKFDALPPNSKFVNITFEMTENDIVKQYQINADLRSLSGNLLNASKEIISDDD